MILSRRMVVGFVVFSRSKVKVMVIEYSFIGYIIYGGNIL